MKKQTFINPKSLPTITPVAKDTMLAGAKTKQVVMYSLEGQPLRVFPSVAIAAKWLVNHGIETKENLETASKRIQSIAYTFSGRAAASTTRKRKEVYGYKWRYLQDINR